MLVTTLLLATSCSKSATTNGNKPDTALQTACDELQRLHSFTLTGLNYFQYSDRLLTAKGIIDVALQHTSDKAAAERVDRAVFCYVEARDNWSQKIRLRNSDIDLQESWSSGGRAVEFAVAYARAGVAERGKLEVRYREEEERIAAAKSAEIERQLQAEKLAQECERAEERRMEEERVAEKRRLEEERIAARERKRKSATESHSVILTFSAADGTHDSSRLYRLTLSDVAIEIPTSEGSRALWFGDMLSCERDIGNFYKITPKAGNPVILRFDKMEELAAMEQELPAAIDAWLAQYRDVISGLPEANHQRRSAEKQQQREVDARRSREDAVWEAEHKKYEYHTAEFQRSIIIAPATTPEPLRGGRSW